MSLVGLGAVLGFGQAQTPDSPGAPAAAPAAAAPAGPEAQARGPMHEAFAAPVSGSPQATTAIAKQPPKPLDEMPAEQKPDGDNMQWIPGYWAWDGERNDYMWVSGFWRAPPPGRTWVPGHWNEVSGGFQWVPGFWQAPEQTEVAYLPAPPAPVQAAPSIPAPNAEAVYVPGCWVWRGDHYGWRPGYWVNYRPNWVWVPAHYAWTPAGYVYVEGYWDYTLRDRGLLFAPVRMDVVVYSRPGYVYRPAFVITDDHMYGAMFVQPAYGCYYYGDYFAVEYRRSGFVAWCDYGHDPLFSYYSWHYRSDPGWSIELRACYVGRYNGTIERPGRTIVVNNTTVINKTVINNTTVNNTTVNNTTVNNRFATNAAPVQTLAQAQKTSAMKLQPVSAAQATTHMQAARKLQELSTQRVQQEKQLVAQRPAGAAGPTTAQVAKLNLPKTESATGAKAPAAPITPHNPAAPSTSATHPGTGTTTPGTHPGATTGTATPGHPGAATPGTTTPGQPGAAGTQLKKPAPQPPPRTPARPTSSEKDKKQNH
jgi:hypothetical protein